MHNWIPSRGQVASTVLLVALFVAGCEKKPDPIVGPDTPPVTGGSISDEARKASLDTLSAFFNRLSGVDPAADRQTVLTFLRTRPEFEATGMSPDGGNVWARFVDGRLALFVNNRKPGSILVNPRIIGSQLRGKTDQLGKVSDVLPSSSTARILNSLGTAFPGAQRSVDSIRTWCKLAGYTLSTPDVATIANLKNMDGDGIFYWAAHGGYGVYRDGHQAATFGMWTADEYNTVNEAKYADDLKAGDVIYMHAPNDIDPGGRPINAWHYAVNMYFVLHEMLFARNSLVYFDACSSGGVKSADYFENIMQNVGFYLGWSLPVADDDADRAARFFFDRTLGMNRNNPKESPPQRPFPIENILFDMTNRGLDVSGSARLVHPFEPAMTTIRLLAPSIGLTGSFFPSTSCTIDGRFGDNPGAAGVVLLNDKPQTISSWTPTQITIQKPQGGGTLVVSVRNVKSNPVNLTEWSGTLDYTFTGRGSLKQHFVFNVKFWADVHSFRPNYLLPSMYMPFEGMGRKVVFMNTSSCSYECSGEYRDNSGALQETWQGSGALPMVDLFSTATGFSGLGQIDSAGTGLGSLLAIEVTGTYTRWTKDNGVSQEPLAQSRSIDFTLMHTMPGFVLKGGTRSSGDATWTWTDMPASFPPDPKASQ